jgi:hypothetical protein
MAAVSTMILRSMRLTGEKGRGATLDTNEQTELLAEFNTFLDACSNERLLAYTLKEDSFALSASTLSYTIGPGGVVNTTRPTRIVDPCYVRDASGFDTPVKVVNKDAYDSIVDKDAGYTVPTVVFYDQGYSATSTGTLYVYPNPGAGLTMKINSWQQIGTVSTLSVNLSLPPGYQLFLESNFAVHTATGITPISPELAKMARDSKAWVKSINSPEVIAPLDYGVSQGSGQGRARIFTG